MMEKGKAERQSNIELLRIISMIMIIAHHFAVHGGFEYSGISVNRLWVQFMQLGGKAGVNIFVLISGYFLSKAKDIKTSKVIKFWLQLFTYSLGLFLIFRLTGLKSFSADDLKRHIFPVTYEQWWFASTYFVMYLLSPYMNRLLGTFDKRGYRRFLLLLGIIWSIIPSLSDKTFQSNMLMWFFFIYSLGGYIRLYGEEIKLSAKAFSGLSVLLVLFILGTAAVGDITGAHKPMYWSELQKITELMLSVCIFMAFLKTDIGKVRAVNVISSAMFGVYLIHDKGFVREYLWGTVFRNASYSESSSLVPYSLFAVAAVFIVCTAIELIRKNTLERLYAQPADKLSDLIDRKLKRI